jgi:hypothetical protein
MKKNSQSGFAHVALVLIVLVLLAVVGGGGYYVWHKNHEKKETPNTSHTDKKVTNYEECLKSEGSIIQDSYPATCVTKDNQRFTQPVEQKYLTIKEWGVKMQLSQILNDGTYHLVGDSKYLPPSAFLSTEKLDASNVCRKYYDTGVTSGSAPSYQRLERYALSAKVSFDEGQTTLTAEQAAAHRPDAYKKIGEYVYHMGKGNGMPCSEQTGDQSDAFNKLFDTLSAE